MLQTLTYAPARILSVILGFSVLLTTLHAKDISAYSSSSFSSILSNNRAREASSNGSAPGGGGNYKIDVDHHPHIDNVTIKSLIHKTTKDSPQTDAKSLRRNRHSATKKVSKKQKHSDAWHTLLMKAI